MFKRILVFIILVFAGVLLISCRSSTTTNTTESMTTHQTTTEVTTHHTTQSSPLTTTNQTETTFVVSFDVKGGSALSPVIVLGGTSIDLPATDKVGYTFLGWTLTEDMNADIITDPLEVDEDTVLYAKWQINQYTVTFDTTGGSSMDEITLDYGSELSLITEPIKDGYTFAGWYLDSELTIPFSLTTMPAEDVTLYAKWETLDWSDVEDYLSDILPETLSEHISLPSNYQDYTIEWSSSHPEFLSDSGIYQRPYQPIIISLTASIQLNHHHLEKVYDIELEGYKSLSAPLTSSYIYRDYNMVDDAFFATLDIINCAFITANSAGTLSGTSVLANINTYIMPQARENGNWVIFSIAPDSDWSAIAANSSRINTFADNIVAMINQYGFDGVDIDWETPTYEEATRFTEMMRVIYTKVKENNPNHLVTAAIAGGMWQPPRYDLENSHQYLDYINMMTYGMVSNTGYYQNALYRSTVFDDPTNSVGKTLTSCSIEESIAIYHTYGIPNSKIIVGAAFYGIKQMRSYDSGTQTWSSWANAGSVSYTSITTYYLNNSNYQYHYDTNAGVPYIISNDGTLFISFDNPRSIAEKCEYIITNGLAGMMYWENGLDWTGALLLAMDAGLND